MKKWEYKIITIGDGDYSEEFMEKRLVMLNKLGKEGWELVNTDHFRMFLKRETTENTDIANLTEGIKKLSLGLCNASLAFNQGYTNNPNISYEDKIE